MSVGANLYMESRSYLEEECVRRGIKMTRQRSIILRVLSDSKDKHPDVEEVHQLSSKYDSSISLATVYRTLRILEEEGIIQKHAFKFGNAKARYEPADDASHHHLINIRSMDDNDSLSEVIEFNDEELDARIADIAKKLGYRLVDCRVELYGVKLRDGDE